MKTRLLATAILIVSTMQSAASAAQPTDIREAWNEAPSAFAGNLRPGLGFSFSYGEQVVGPEVPTDWQASTTRKNDLIVTVLRHSSGLTVTREARLLPRFHAIEYKLRFKNTAAKPLPPLTAIDALHISFGAELLYSTCVVSSGGGVADSVIPPRDFSIRRTCFTPMIPEYDAFDLTTEGGRSSNKDLPIFFLDNDHRHEGIIVAFGWSGQWEASVKRDSVAKTLNVTGRIPDIDIALQPGEEIEGPTVLLVSYHGTVSDGSNDFRQLIRDVYTPKLAGNTFTPVATYDHWFNIGTNFDEALLKKLVDAAASIHQEYFLVDAGWFMPSEGKGFLPGVGNWELVDTDKFPNGLKPISDYARSKGLKFGLWFEPERVGPNSKLAKEHPNWVLWSHAKNPENSFNDLAGNSSYGLLNYGRPEVQRWVRNIIDSYIRQYGVKYIRYDFNMDPLLYWERNDPPHRKGTTQLRHIRGFYSTVDWIRDQHPDTILEGCASGGRRIDLETARRFHTFWISDYTVDPAIIRYHLFGINYFLPGNYSYIQYTLPTPNQVDFHPDDLGFQSLFGGAFGVGGRVDLWSEQMREMARKHVDVWKTIRHYLLDDYYPLSEQLGSLDSWSAWQFQDPKDKSGFIQTFRTNTDERTHNFLVQHLDSDATYEFTNAYTNEVFEMNGSDLLENGLSMTQDPMSSKLLIYREIQRKKLTLNTK